MTRGAPRESVERLPVFSFLAVLVCFMGCLLALLILVGQRAQATVVDEKASSPDAQPASSAKDQEELEKLRAYAAKLADARGKFQQRMAADRQSLAHLEDHTRRLRDDMQKLRDEAKRVQQDGVKETRSQEEMLAELKRLARLKEDSARLLSDTQRTAAARPSFSIIPYEGPHATHRRPVYIECRDDAIIIQPEGIRFTDDDFKPAKHAESAHDSNRHRHGESADEDESDHLSPDNPLASAMRAATEYIARNDPAHASGGAYPLLIVRPSSIEAYYAARAALMSFGEDFGYELVDEDWKLKYSTPDPQLASVVQSSVEVARRRMQFIAMNSGGGTGGTGSGAGGAGGTGGGSASGTSGSRGPGPGGINGGTNGNGGLSGLGNGGQRGGANGVAGVSGGGNGYGPSPGMGGGSALQGSGGAGQEGGGPYLSRGDSGYGGASGGRIPGGGPGGVPGGTGGPYAGPGSNGGPGGPYSNGGIGGPYGPGGSGGAATNGIAGGPGGQTGGAGGQRVGIAGQPASYGGQPGSSGQPGGNGQPGGSGGPGQAGGNFAGSATPGAGAAGSPAGATGNTNGQQGVAGIPGMSGAPPPGIPTFGQQQTGNSTASAKVGEAQKFGEYIDSPRGRGGSAGADDSAGPSGPGGGAPKLESVAESRGENWALPTVSRGSVGITRLLRVDVSAGSVLVYAGGRSAAPKEVHFTGQTRDSVEEFVSQVWDQMRGWGIAGRGMYWKPKLSIHVLPGGEQRANELRDLLSHSGLELQPQP